MKSGLETYSERQIESLKAVIAEQQERIGELEAEVERLKERLAFWQEQVQIERERKK